MNRKTQTVWLGVGSLMALFVLGVVIWQYWPSGAGARTEPAAAPKADVCLITGADGLEDPVGKALWKGIESAAQKAGWTIGSLRAKDAKQYAARLSEASAAYKLVVCYGQGIADELERQAARYPNTRFLLFDGRLLDAAGDALTLANVLAVTFRIEEGGFLAGYLAEKISAKSCVGYISGADEQGKRAYYGFYSGALYANLNCEVLKGLTGNRTDRYRTKQLAGQMYTAGAGVIFQGTGYLPGRGIAEAAREQRKLMIGSEIEQHGDEILTSAVKCYDEIVDRLLTEARYRTLIYGRHLDLGFAEQALDFPEPAEGRVAASTWQQVQNIRAKIEQGTMNIPKTEAEFAARFH